MASENHILSQLEGRADSKMSANTRQAQSVNQGGKTLSNVFLASHSQLPLQKGLSTKPSRKKQQYL